MQTDERDKIKTADDSIVANNVRTSKAIHAKCQVKAYCLRVLSNKHINDLVKEGEETNGAIFLKNLYHNEEIACTCKSTKRSVKI